MFTLNSPDRRRTRTRASSVSSTVSLGPIFEITKAQPTSGVSQQPERHEAHGSFVPLRSATPSLQTFISYRTLHAPKKRRRRVTFDDRISVCSAEFWDPGEDLSSPKAPYITRTSPPSHLGTPMPSSPATGLHPILAKLERKSRLCTQIVQCSTCKKKGGDFPYCPKCGDMWCSRPCRLVGGKRHTCSNRM